MATVEDWNKLKVTDLKTELKQRGLSLVGRKEELVQRLADHEQGITSGEAPADGQTDANGAEAGADNDTAMDEDVQPTETATDAAEATDVAAAAAPAQESAEQPSADTTQDVPPVPSPPAPVAAVAAVAVAGPVEQKRKHDSPPPLSMDIDDGEPASPKRQKVDEERDDAPMSADADIDMADTADPAGDDFVEDIVGVSSSSPPSTSAAIHPVTNGLYIANLMRPLRPMLLDRCMADIAGSKDAVVESFLDPIKTHAFVVFRDADAAARVRNKLHGTVWPDERSRRPLWIDFVPVDAIRGWIDEEKSDRGFFKNTGRGGGVNSRFDAVKRWELVYSTRSDVADGGDGEGEGEVVTTLRQIGSSTPEITGRILFDASMLPGPSNQRGSGGGGGSPPPFDAPRGPRAKEVGPGSGMMVPEGPKADQQQRRRRGRGGDGVLDDEIRTTRTGPPLDYQVVHPDLVRRRLDNILAHRKAYAADGRRRSRSRSRSRSRDPRGGAVQSEYTKTHNRYSFEGGFELVDRGPEQFDGIRPPHRERERRQQRARGGGGGGGGGGGPRFGVGGGGGGGGGPPTGPAALGGRRRRHRGGRDRRRGYDDYRPGRSDGPRGDGRLDDQQRDWRDERRDRKEREGGRDEGRLGYNGGGW